MQSNFENWFSFIKSSDGFDSSDQTDQKQAFDELQSILDKQSKELTEYRHKITDIQQRLKETEDKMRQSEDKTFNISKELLISQETNKKLQRDLKESLLQKDDQEQRISTLEQRYVNLQREYSSLNELNSRLETQLSIKDNSFKHVSQFFFATDVVRVYFPNWSIQGRRKIQKPASQTRLEREKVWATIEEKPVEHVGVEYRSSWFHIENHAHRPSA